MPGDPRLWERFEEPRHHSKRLFDIAIGCSRIICGDAAGRTNSYSTEGSGDQDNIKDMPAHFDISFAGKRALCASHSV
jgi:hypothetical protein